MQVQSMIIESLTDNERKIGEKLAFDAKFFPRGTNDLQCHMLMVWQKSGKIAK